ncbi:helicase-related protein [Sphingobacterium sp.]|uniref:helicase-related protein n=1 Tax=Sphingobacterium sp. TaxID=341027 RepID=UPI0028AD5CD2|nr:helicase-related protein [Sphingobacterium sp.]
MKQIIQKRNSLEEFIIAQTLGPGVNGYKYIDIKDINLLPSSDLLEESPLNYKNEILDILPAAVYSTGILFPKDDSNTLSQSSMINNEILEEDYSGSEEQDIQNNSNLDIDENGIDANQLYPRSMGMTFCLNEGFLKENFLSLEISFRYYTLVDPRNEENYSNRFGVLNERNLSDFLNLHGLSNNFRIVEEENGKNKILLLDSKEFDFLNAKIKEISQAYVKQFKSELDNILDEKLTIGNHVPLSTLVRVIFERLQRSIVDKTLRVRLYEFSQDIEEIENIISHLKDILNIHSKKNQLWKAETITRIIEISSFDFGEGVKKKIFSTADSDDLKVTVKNEEGKVIGNSLEDIFSVDLCEKYQSKILDKNVAALSLNLQFSRDAKRKSEKIFVKAQLLNTSTPYLKSQHLKGNYFSPFNDVVNIKSFFGVKISVTNNHIQSYLAPSFNNAEGNFDEDTTTKFIYKEFEDYAVGHGCSVSWQIKSNLKKVETEYIPACETPDIDPVPRNKSKSAVLNDKNEYIDPLFVDGAKFQQFKWLSSLSDVDDNTILSGLYQFVDSYKVWIDNKKADYQVKNREIATQELNKCEKDYVRMRQNITELLEGQCNYENLSSFRWMNTAMFMQLWHSSNSKEENRDSIYKEGFSTFNESFYKDANDCVFVKNEPAEWRAFQLAFILLNLDGIFKSPNDIDWKARNKWVDLVWFPTGGGKTEAYLGLIALTIINRRKLLLEEGGGVAAIMRYTLRLLTMQQFQRATLLIMALELVRRWNIIDLGSEPITIGLWVGDNSIPNKVENLIEEYRKLNNGSVNKIPFSKCPWCGSKLDPIPVDNQIKDPNDIYAYKTVPLFCSDERCSFSMNDILGENINFSGIPVNLCDETIYRHPPTLLFGTVDKFAQLAHKLPTHLDKRYNQENDSRRLFGRGIWEQGKPINGYYPPDLIIQDELHLLLGPLGSAVALFESVVDHLCTRPDGTRAKVISSTATTRNTQLQIAALFDREVRIFPKSGVESDDSYFAFYKRTYLNPDKDSKTYISKRKYLGILPTGRTQMWMQMRLISIALVHRALFETNQIKEAEPIDFEQYNELKKVIDYYHTVISYFNSIKEVGKTQSQVQTYILKEIRRVFNRVIRPRKLMHGFNTYGPLKESELTGRLSGEEVKNSLKYVESSWSAEKRFAGIDKNKKLIKAYEPPEFIVATNMISVGIDVSRFNTIIMNSMPRNIAEYIQASSRVARNDSGLVITIHHPFRARDISHYEKFIEFHEKMYSYVEPISITPFTKKSIDRYMGLFLATYLRHQFPALASRKSAKNFSSEYRLLVVEQVKNFFESKRKRILEIDKDLGTLLSEKNIEYVLKWVHGALDDWEKLITECGDSIDLVFNNVVAKAIIPEQSLYVDLEEYDWNPNSSKWQIPMSLRVIEPEAAISIKVI